MITFIWDLDGTLIDSYNVIVDSLYEVYKEVGAPINRRYILKKVLRKSVQDFIEKMESEYHIPFSIVEEKYVALKESRKNEIGLVEHALELLNFLKEKGINSFIFTHRGKSTAHILDNLGITNYFKEVVTSLNGFPRKPHPRGLNYLIDKYHLDKDNTYYVGDRHIDIDCAINANIKSILFIKEKEVSKPSNKENYIIYDLLEIKDLFML